MNDVDNHIIPPTALKPVSKNSVFSRSIRDATSTTTPKRLNLMSQVDTAINSTKTQKTSTIPSIGAILNPTTLPSYIDCSDGTLFVTNVPIWFERHLSHFGAKSAQHVDGFPGTVHLKFASPKEAQSAAHSLHGRTVPDQQISLEVVHKEQITFLYDLSTDAMTTIVVIENLPSNVLWKSVKDMTTKAKCSATVNIPKFEIKQEDSNNSTIKYCEIRFQSTIMAKRFIDRYNGKFFDPLQSDVPPMDIYFRFLRDAQRAKQLLTKIGLTKEELLDDYKSQLGEDEMKEGQIILDEITRQLL